MFDAWQHTFGQSQEANLELFFSDADKPVTQQELNDYCDNHYEQYIDMLVIYDGAVDVLKQMCLQFNNNVAIVTNCPRAIADLILVRSGFLPHLKHVVCAGDTIDTALYQPEGFTAADAVYQLKPKKSPDTLLYACALLGVQPANCYFVGDTLHDMHAAEAAGCYSVGVGINGSIRIERIAELTQHI